MQKTALAERILKSAARGERDRKRLRSAALTLPPKQPARLQKAESAGSRPIKMLIAFRRDRREAVFLFMSAIGTKRTWPSALHMAAFNQSGHNRSRRGYLSIG